MSKAKWDLVSAGPIYVGARAAIAAGPGAATRTGKALYLERIEDDRGASSGWYRLTDIRPDDEFSSPFLPSTSL